MANIIDVLKYIIGIDTKELQRGAKDADRKVKEMSTGIQHSLRNVAAAFGVAFGARSLMRLVGNLTMTAARSRELQVVLENVGKVAGYSADFLAQEEQKIKELGITTSAARTLLIRFMQSQLDVANAAKIARAAQDLAVIAQMDSSEAAETLTYAIAAQRPILLRQFGIVTDLSEIFNQHAKTLGKSAENLTEYEKRMAFFNVVMEQASRVAGTYESAMTTAGKQSRSLARYQEEAAIAVGKKFQGALIEAVSATTQFFKGIQATFDPLGVAIGHQLKYAQYVRGTSDNIDRLVERYVDLADTAPRTNEQQAEMNDLMAKLLKILPEVRTQYDAFGNVIALHVPSLRQSAQAFKDMYETERKALELELARKIDETKTAINDQAVALENLLRLVQEGRRGYINYEAVMERTRGRIAELREELRGYESQMRRLKGISEGFIGPLPLPDTTDTELKKISDATLKMRTWFYSQLIQLDEKYRFDYIDSLKALIDDERLTAEQRLEVRRLLIDQYMHLRQVDLDHAKKIKQDELDFIETSDAEIAAGMEAMRERTGAILDERAEKIRRTVEEELRFTSQIYGAIGDVAGNAFRTIILSHESATKKMKAILEDFLGAIVNVLARWIAQEITSSLMRIATHKATETAMTAITAQEEAKRAAIRAAAATAGPFAWLGIPFLHAGGLAKFQRGGLVGGDGASYDSILAALQPGEFVMPRRAVERIGMPMLEQMRKTGTAAGSVTINIDMSGFTFTGKKADATLVATTIRDRVAEAVDEAVKARKLVL